MSGSGYDVEALRAGFPALTEGAAHFDAPGGTQTPRVVADAVSGALTSAIANRGTVTVAEQRAEGIVSACRLALADLLGCDPRGVIFGRSTTALTYDISRAMAKTWHVGDEVIVTRLDHDANIRPWVQAAASVGATIRWADFDPGAGELASSAITSLLTDRTRLVAVTGASNLIGTQPDIPGIAAAAHDAGALVYVDAVHLAAHAAIDTVALGADLLACSPYKWMGPHCGVVAANPDVLATLHPDKLLPSTDAVPERFELGTLPYELMAGTTAAVDFLASLPGMPTSGSRRDRIVAGMAAVAAHEDPLRERLEQGILQLPGARVWSRAARRTPTLLVSFADHSAETVSVALVERGINAPAGSFYALECSRHLGLGDTGGLRLGFAPYNTADDVERAISALVEIVG